MMFTTYSLFGRAARTTAAGFVLLSALVAGSASASAQARVDNGRHLGWDKNGKAAQKAERKAEKQAARQFQRPTTVVVTPNGQVVDRSRVRVAAPTPRAPYYGNNGNNRNNNYRYNNQYPTTGWSGPIIYDGSTGRIYRQNNGSRCEYPSYGNYGNANYGYGNNGYGYNNAGYGYGNSYGYPYYNNGHGDLSSNEVAERARQSGYNAGFQRGAYDAAQGNHPNPQGHGAFQFGFDGFDPSWGSAQTYQQTYRQYFIQGYNDGFRRNQYNTQYRRRY